MGRPADRLAAGLVALPCLFLLGLSLFSARAALLALPHDGVFDDVAAGRKVTSAHLEAAANANLDAASWFDSAHYRTVGASALIAQSRRAPVATETMERPIRQALSVEPASPFNWLRLAALRFRAGDTRGAARAWEMSVETGRLKPAIMTARLSLGLQLLPSQGDAFEALLKDQAVLTARMSPVALAQFARESGNGPAIRAMLASDSQGRREFRKAIEFMRWKALCERGIYKC